VANLYWVYDIKARQFLSCHEQSADATTALRKHVGKSGSKSNEKIAGAVAANCEVITVTR
jgi:hypothetical protein